MDVQKITREFRIKHWIDIIKECRSSGQTIKSWCEEQGINLKSYYYWQRKVRKVTGEKYAMIPGIEHGIASIGPDPVFAEIKLQQYKTALPAVTIHLNNATLEIQNGAERSTIENTLRALRSLC
jgi:hypothetical protein